MTAVTLAPPSEVRNVVVFLKDAPARDVAPTRAGIRQRNETFLPRVVAVPVGSEVEFPNDDPFYHNVFSLSRSRAFNLGRYPKGQTRVVRFDKPGIVKVFCDIHSHMSAAVMVFNHPWYAIPDDDGRFEIADVPHGRPELVAWHERLGDTTMPRARGARPRRVRGVHASRSRPVRRPPRLVTRTLGVTFITVAVILSVVFTVLLVDARDRVRAAELEKLQVGERAYSRFEAQRQREQAAALAAFGESSALKAALDTYSSETTRPAPGSIRDAELNTTVAREVERLATLTSTDIAATLDPAGRVFASGGPAAALLAPGEVAKSLVGPMASSGVAVLTGARSATPARRCGSATARWARCWSARSSATSTRASWRACRTPGSSSPSTTAWWPARPATR